ncbi:TetR/AcrR family transcriptional regulator [Parasphingorhabdus sp.]|uniref:TetR/AcrR family transcriptional regulator n=1 Tax=Parasphingorhabdus sp. TaxID=2709688 RepID=UPI003262D0CD
MAAARAEFLKSGYSASSIEAIAARAEVSKVTVYSWFQSKENLFGEMVKAECSRMSEGVVGENLEAKNLRDILILVAENMMGFLMDDERIRFDRILAAEVNRDPRIGEQFLDNGPRALLNNITKLLQIFVDKGEIQSDDLSAAAAMFVSLVVGRIEMMLRYGEKINLTGPEKSERAKRAVDAWMLIHQA